MSEVFDRAFEIVIGNEGGYVDHPGDPGGATKYGISQRSYPNEDIKNLTLERAKDLYFNDYWLPLQAFDLPDPIAIMLFDMAVNHGKVRAVQILQGGAGVKTDGLLGPITRARIKALDWRDVVIQTTAERIIFYTSLAAFKTFGLGWVMRALNLLGTLLKTA